MEVIVKKEEVVSCGACCVDKEGNIIHPDGHKQTVTTVTIDHGSHMEVVLPSDPRFPELVKQWGGKRPGAGRPVTGRTPRRLQATDEEWALIRAYADKARSGCDAVDARLLTSM